MMTLLRRSGGFALIGAMIAIIAVAFAALGASKDVNAQSSGTPDTCHVLLMIDRSSSIGDNWDDMYNQIRNLFLGLSSASKPIALGYWTFSNVSDPAVTDNYNAPYHEFVNTIGDPSGTASFMNTLPANGASILGGQTNYEQAFGYNTFDSSAGPQQNSTPPNAAQGVGDLDEIHAETDVLALLTDGLPNYPTGPDGAAIDGNPTAVARGHAARAQFDGKPAIGAYVKPDGAPTPDLRSLYTTINGDPNDSSNVGPLSFNSIEEYLTEAIERTCDVDTVDYSLVPTVNVDQDAVQTGDSINYSYSVENNTADGASGNSGWQLFDVTINPTVSGNPLIFEGSSSGCPAGGGQPYCQAVDNCSEILSIIGGQGTCNAVPTGGRGNCGSSPSTSPGNGSYTFTPGGNDAAFYSPPRCQTIDDLPLGTRVCSMLYIARPTQTAASGRMSSAACVTVGKTPLVQIHGGDLRVGHRFNGDTSTLSDSDGGIYTTRFTARGTAVPNGRVFGSWVEYGVLAPNAIQRVASLSGYSNGYDGGPSSSGCDLNTNRLTFSNTPEDEDGNSDDHDPECGYFAEGAGIIPDVVSALTSRTPIDPTRYSLPLQLTGDSIPGLYRNTNSNANFEIGNSTIANSATEKGKAYIVYVPNGTVTITGNIVQSGDSYAEIKEIPQLVIIAREIKIREGVASIDAWLVSPGTSDTEGIINTCVNNTGNTPNLSSAVCDEDRPGTQSDLRVNGPVMARDLLLWRTKVDKSDPVCRVDTTDACRDVGTPAELFNLSGSSVLWALGYGSNASRAQTSYTVELPPYY